MSPTLPAAIHVTVAPAAPATRFVVGQDPLGRWVAAEIHGLAGGLFRTRSDALHYACAETGRRPDAVVIATGRIELRI